MNRPSHLTILAEPLAFWAANCNKKGEPDIVKCNGILFPDNLEQLTFFISDKFSHSFKSELYPGSQLTFMGCSVASFESYQYKGTFLSIRECTPEDEELQKNYLDGFTGMLQKMGFPKQVLFEAYYHQPSYALVMTIREIYEQTPRHGTGNMITSKGGTL